MPPSTETILIASDHAGFALKAKLAAELTSLGYDVQDMGPSSDASIDYADYAHPLAKRVSDGENTRGVLLCGTGLGMSYTANRYPHVRAAAPYPSALPPYPSARCPCSASATCATAIVSAPARSATRRGADWAIL